LAEALHVYDLKIRYYAPSWIVMPVCLPKMRLIAGVLLTVMYIIPCFGQGGEPSSRLKEADTDYKAGVAALSRSDLDTARADFENVVRLAPSAEQGHSALGAVLIRLGRRAEGIRELEKALAIQPSDSSAQLNLAFAYEQSNEAVKALPWFAKLDATSRAKQHALPPYVLAAYVRALVVAQQFPAAVAKLKQALKSDPQNAELHDELGSVYAQQKDWPNARLAFMDAIRLRPDFAIAHMHLGLTLQSEQLPGALDELTKAYQLAPKNAVVAAQLGQALANAGQDDQAIPILEDALELDPNSATVAYQLGLAFQRINKVQNAIPLLQKAAAADPNNAEVLTNLGMALCQAQKPKDAVPILQRAVAQTPENTTAREDLAAAYIQLSQFDDAVNQLRQALKLSPNASQLHYNLGIAFKMQDDASDAIPELESAEKLDPSAPEPPYALGTLYMEAARYADAARELESSLKLRPENGEGWVTLGSVYDHLDKLPKAAAALREAIRQLPQQSDPHLMLASVLAKQNQPRESAAERKQGADLMRSHMNRQRAEVASNSGSSLLKSGKTAEAIVDFRDAVSYDQNYAPAHMGLAQALAQQGKVVEAAAERQKAQALGETSAEQ
jgi:protein O-GlcNAc transferase